MAGRKKRGGSDKLEFYRKLQAGGELKYDPAEVRFPTAKDTQVGGDHYKWMAIQPAEYAHRNGLGFLEGNVVKYVTRHDRKGGKQDLLKAIHCLQLLIEYQYGEPANTKTNATT